MVGQIQVRRSQLLRESYITHETIFSDAVLCCTQMVVSMAHKIKLLFFFQVHYYRKCTCYKKETEIYSLSTRRLISQIIPFIFTLKWRCYAYQKHFMVQLMILFCIELRNTFYVFSNIVYEIFQFQNPFKPSTFQPIILWVFSYRFGNHLFTT